MNIKNKLLKYLFIAILFTTNHLSAMQNNTSRFPRIVVLPFTQHDGEYKVLLVQSKKFNIRTEEYFAGGYSLLGGTLFRGIGEKESIKQSLFDKTRGAYKDNLDNNLMSALTIHNCRALKPINKSVTHPKLILFFINIPYRELEELRSAKPISALQEEILDFSWVSVNNLVEMAESLEKITIPSQNPFSIHDCENKYIPIFEGFWKLLKYHKELKLNLLDIIDKGKPCHYIRAARPTEPPAAMNIYSGEHFANNFTTIIDSTFGPSCTNLSFGYFIYTHTGEVLLTKIKKGKYAQNTHCFWNLLIGKYNIDNPNDQLVLDNLNNITQNRFNDLSLKLTKTIVIPNNHLVLFFMEVDNLEIPKELYDQYKWVYADELANANFFVNSIYDNFENKRLRLFAPFNYRTLKNPSVIQALLDIEWNTLEREISRQLDLFKFE